MPKQKTRKCAAKRFKQTGTGKFRRNQANGRHLMRKKTPKRRRRLRRQVEVSSADHKRVSTSVPYGI